MKSILKGRVAGRVCRPIWLMTAAALGCVPALPAANAASAEQLQEAFRQLDADADGRVSAVEFENRKIYVFNLRDANDDHMIQQSEVDIEPQQFQAADRDGDGQISGLEFVESPVGQFSNYDADRDGFMTLDELAIGAASAP